jgi:hypothetical protein
MFVPVPAAGAWGVAELLLVGGVALLGLAAGAGIVLGRRERSSQALRPEPAPPSAL